MYQYYEIFWEYNMTKWQDIKSPWAEIEGLQEIVLDKVAILDILNKYGIECMQCSSGEFTHKLRCPLPAHSNGNERTASMYLSEKNNSFYCFGCLEENELIWTEGGLKKIIDVVPGMKVIDKFGKTQNVIGKSIKNKKTVGIETKSFRNDPLCLTSDHTCIWIKKDDIFDFPFLSYRKNSDIGLRLSNKISHHVTSSVKITEGPAHDIEIGDFLLFPVIPDVDRVAKDLHKDGIIKKYTKGPIVNRISCLPANINTARLYGLWLAEGSTSRGMIRFTYNINEKDTLAKNTQDILMKEFGLTSTIFNFPKHNTCEVICCKTDLEHLFLFWFGHGAANKKIPYEIIYWPKELQRNLIRGYLDGDGNKNRDTAATVSQNLAYSLFNLCIQADYPVSLSKRNGHIDIGGTNHKDFWIINIKEKETIYGFFGSIDGHRYYICPVTKKENNNIIKKVVDISVENTNSFTTKLGVVHNCSSGGSIITFLMLYLGIPYQEALNRLATIVGLTEANASDFIVPQKEHRNYDQTIMFYIFKSSAAIREYLKSIKNSPIYKKRRIWADKQFRKLDEFLDKLEDNRWPVVKEYYDNLVKHLNLHRENNENRNLKIGIIDPKKDDIKRKLEKYIQSS